MFNNKKGLSTVVTTLIIILLVLVAIGIICVVVRGIIEQTTNQVDYNTKCLQVDVRATAVNCTTVANCDVTLTRSSGGEPINGVRMAFKNTSTGTSSTTAFDSVGDIPVLTTVKRTTVLTTMTDRPNVVETTAYFNDATGTAILCSQTNSFKF